MPIPLATLRSGAIPLTTTPIQNSPVVGGTPTGSGIASVEFTRGDRASTYSTTSSTYANVDNTNLQRVFVIPAGWKLSVSATGVFAVAAATTSASLILRDSITALSFAALQSNIATAGQAIPWSLVGGIEGDGRTHTVALQFASSDNATAVTITNNSSNYPTMIWRLEPAN